jgi:malate synthase
MAKRDDAELTLHGRQDSILSSAALSFIAQTTRIFEADRQALLKERGRAKEERKAGKGLDFLPETREIRERSWRVREAPAAVRDRRVEITGPVDRKMVINGLNSGANVFMADFEDATSPTWDNILSGHTNVRDALARTISLVQGERTYRLNTQTAVLFVRPRGLHLPENHVRVGGVPISATLFDLALHAWLNAVEVHGRGQHCYLYIPKLESHLEARWIARLLAHFAEELNVPVETFRVTVLIETLPAAFQMDEILYELRENILGLNCGRWDYIFSFIKTQVNVPGLVLPDRAVLTMDSGFLKAYSELLIQTCHKRGAFAMGGMAAQIPIKNDSAQNELALAKVRADKLREARAGHDGTWVAHPALVPIAKEIFDREMRGPNQLDVLREDVKATRDLLLAVPTGAPTEKGLRHNIRVALHYLEAWLRGIGCVPIYHLMEDAATAEIARAQIWLWIRNAVTLEGFGELTTDAFVQALDEEARVVERELEGRERSRLQEARTLLSTMCLAETLADFLTLPAYEQLTLGGSQ